MGLFIKKYFKIVLIFVLLFISHFSFSETEFPGKLSDKATISILSVNYNDLTHSLFSKNCLRVFDKENEFDQIVDFAYFDNFDDDFFLLKFFIRGKKAQIRSEPFINYFLTQSKKTTVSLTESVLKLSPKEVAYIYSFLRTLHKALPFYEYDFDILTNNSETHISRILHDADRMAGNKQTNESYVFSKIQRHKLQFHQIDDTYVLLNDKENLEFHEQDFSKIFHEEQFLLIVMLCVFSGFVFLITAYQVLVYFFERLYIVSIFKSIQIFDFLILFIAGVAGIVIVLQDFFSNQSLFRNNFQFLSLFPLHVIAAFTIFKPISNRKFHIIYWSVASALSYAYIFALSIIKSELPLVSMLFTLPLFLRTLYFDFIAIGAKTRR